VLSLRVTLFKKGVFSKGRFFKNFLKNTLTKKKIKRKKKIINNIDLLIDSFTIYREKKGGYFYVLNSFLIS